MTRSFSGVSIFTCQNAAVTPERRPIPIAPSLNVGSERGTENKNPNSKDATRIVSCLGLTQTTLRGMPLLDQREVSLNQRMRTTTIW